jgi:vacuolar-type H+-ATPase subunit C/Vma6
MKAVGADFNFLCGILRSRESSLMSRQKLESIIAAGNSGALQAPEGLFGERVRSVPGVDGIEAGYKSELAAVVDLLRFSPSEEFTRLVFLPWDFHNLKAAVLRKLDGRGGEELFGPEGEVAAARLAEMADTMEFDGLPPRLHTALQEAMKAYYEEDKDSQSFELSLDRQKQRAQEELSKSLSPAIHAHYRTISDIAIADVFFRAFFSRLPWKRISWGFAGHPDAVRLKLLFNLKVVDWGGHLAGISCRVLQRLILSVSTLEEAAAAVLREKREHLASMASWSYKPPSAEYAFYFVTRKLADIYNLRLVLLGAFGRIPKDDIMNRINDAFI